MPVGDRCRMSKSTASTLSTLAPETIDYLKEEQKQRRKEIDALIDRRESDQRNGLILAGVIWSWLATDVSSVSGSILVIVVFLPPFIMAFFFFRLHRIDQTIGVIAEYTRKLELLFAIPDDYGWERWWLTNRRNDYILPAMSKTFWYIFFLINCIPGIYLAIYGNLAIHGK